MPRHYTLSEVCTEIGKGHVYLGQIQTALDLYRPELPKKYSRAYINFLTKCTGMRTFGVTLPDITDLFEKEIKILRMLNFDTHSKSPSWYLDACTLDASDPQRLLLTGYPVGFDIRNGSIQVALDFGGPEPELFDSHDMGESLEHVLDLYFKQVNKIKRRIEEEQSVIRTALTWSNKTFGQNGF